MLLISRKRPPIQAVEPWASRYLSSSIPSYLSVGKFYAGIEKLINILLIAKSSITCPEPVMREPIF